MKRIAHFCQRGLTLLELTVVLLILLALAGLVVPYVGNTGSTSMCRTTDATMQGVREAIMGGRSGAGFYDDTLGNFPAVVRGGDKYALHFLFSARDVDAQAAAWMPYNAKTAVGWRGPYLTPGTSLDTPTLARLDASFGAEFDPADPARIAYLHVNLLAYDGADADAIATVTEAAQLIHVLDGWGRPIVLQVPYDTSNGKFNLDYARLVSAGPGSGIKPEDAKIDAKIQYDSGVTPLPAADDRNDDRILYLKLPDPAPGGNIPCDRI